VTATAISSPPRGWRSIGGIGPDPYGPYALLTCGPRNRSLRPISRLPSPAPGRKPRCSTGMASGLSSDDHPDVVSARAVKPYRKPGGTIPHWHGLWTIPIGRLPVPTSLQYPLERQRDLQRRWNRLLQRTAPKDHPSRPLTSLRVPSPLNRSSTSSASKNR
jgi:hypothetical protein